MRKKLALMLAVGLVAGAFGSVASAQRQDNPKVTGGGQIDVSLDGGAGNTITFYGEDFGNTGDRGQVQYVGTASGGGSAEDHWHGVVDCVVIDFASPDPGNEPEVAHARLSGTKFFRGQSGDQFWLEVFDNGTPAQGSDLIRINDDATKDCNDEEDSFHESELARGNATVHNPPGE